MKYLMIIVVAIACAAAGATEFDSAGGVIVSLPVVEVPKVPAAIEAATLDLPNAKAVSVPSPAADMPRQIAFQKELQTLFRDRRSVNMAAASPDDTAWQKWLALYKSQELLAYQPEYQPLAPGLRIICEVRCPVDMEDFSAMRQRVDYYAGRGYNAVLVTFDTTENLQRLCLAVDYLKHKGLKVVIAYSGAENLRVPVMRDPDVLAEWLEALGSRADALLLGWRRTSVHLFLPDKQFASFIIKAARAQNPSLATIGMAYYGETAALERGVTYEVPEHCSAVLIVGLGYPGTSSKAALQKLFPKIADHPHKVGLVVGERPYFDSKNATGKTYSANEAIKRQIETRLLAAGCASTMTYSGDGSDGAYGNTQNTENLCRQNGARE